MTKEQYINSIINKIKDDDHYGNSIIEITDEWEQANVDIFSLGVEEY